MHLNDFSGERIFIDSNIFIYVSSKEHSLKSVCEDFLLKIENGEILGFINGRIESYFVERFEWPSFQVHGDK